MAYSVNGKIYTDHPLMDEIVDCCKTIFNGIVVKNDVLAISYETDESLAESEEFIHIVEDRITFATFPFTEDMLKAYTKDGVRVYSDSFIDDILEDRYVIPSALRSETLIFCKKYYIEDYCKNVEKNNYYRSLAGLPPNPDTVYNIKRERSDSKYNIYVYPTDFPADYDISRIPWHRPDDPDHPEYRVSDDDFIYIHELSKDDVSILQQSGFVDQLISEYQGFNYSYLRYLGYKSIDIYKARKAIKWEILYIPTVEQLVQQRFIELYNINRSMYLKRTYQDAMSLGSNHYDESLILLLLCQTFNDMIVDVPEWYIRRDIFDIRSVQYFLESFGVEFFSVIPLKYQIAIVKNLNKLIKYKSSMKNINDIIDMFDLKGTYAYKYYLYKKKINDSTSEDPNNYDLEFIKVKQGDVFDKYVDDNIYRYKYNDLTLSDKFWDGVYREWKPEDKPFREQLHEEIKDAHIDRADYTIEGTKYMSIDYEIDMSEYQYQVEYFFSFLLDSELDSDDIKIIVPTISTSSEIKMSDLFVMLYLLSFSYEGVSDKIRRPEDNINHKDHIITPLVEWYEQLYTDDGDYDDYIKWNEIFGTYVPPKYFDSQAFNFGGVQRISSFDDDREFNFGDIMDDLDHEFGDYDFNETLFPPDTDEGYDFITSNWGEDPYAVDVDYNFYQSPPEEIPNPDIDEGFEFNGEIDTDPDEYYRKLFKPRHWEVKSYIENQDPIATAEGYNSFPIWVDNRDWIYHHLPDALKTSYNRINGFNLELTTDDLDELLEFIEHRNKVYNFDCGYNGYSYRPVYNVSGDILYYEITYEYAEPAKYNFEEHKKYVAPTLEIEGDPDYNAHLYTLEGYQEWLDYEKDYFMFKNPRGPLGIAGFRIARKLDTVQDIIDDFDINTICYKDLSDRIINSQNRDENVILRHVFKVLFTRKFDYKFYSVNGHYVNNMSAILKDRNYVLYNYYNTLISEPNVETRQDNIRSVMNDIITTLEYYLRGDNFEFIYSSFTISSFSSLLYYIYLMITFFKSWKVYFLDPAVTMNTNDKLENGNNYGQGCDNIAEIKTNYWNEDKEFKRDSIGYNFDITPKDYVSERYKEVLDVYGRYDPDPTSDNDYDGYDATESIVRTKDVDGGVVDGRLNIPYNMINGGKAYGKLQDIWDLDGSTPEEHIIVSDANGGGPYHQEDYHFNKDIDNLYVINAGNPGTNLFWTKTMHTKVVDRQIEQEVLVSDKEANVLVSDENGVYIAQAWASWDEFNYYSDSADTAYSYINYVMDVLYDDLVIIADEDALQAEINRIINDDLAGMRKVVNFAKNIDIEKANYKGYIDNSVNGLKLEFSDFNPYSWENFDE